MREFRTYGSVRGASGNGRPYRDQLLLVSEASRGRGAVLTPSWDRDPPFGGTETHDMTQDQKIIRAKVGLLELAKQLGNVSRLQDDGLQPRQLLSVQGAVRQGW